MKKIWPIVISLMVICYAFLLGYMIGKNVSLIEKWNVNKEVMK